MKMFKYFDWCVQTALLLIGICNAIFNSKNFIYSYFIVGAGNVVSCIIHAWLDYGQEKGSARSDYQRLLVLLLVIGALLLLAAIAGSPAFLYFLVALLLISPVMALMYYWITWNETAALFREEKICKKETYSPSKTPGHEQ